MPLAMLPWRLSLKSDAKLVFIFELCKFFAKFFLKGLGYWAISGDIGRIMACLADDLVRVTDVLALIVMRMRALRQGMELWMVLSEQELLAVRGDDNAFVGVSDRLAEDVVIFHFFVGGGVGDYCLGH